MQRAPRACVGIDRVEAAAAHVDDDWNVEKWGVDEEVAARRAARFIDFRAAVTILEAMKA